MLGVINVALDKGSFNSSTNATLITLLLKSKYDPAQCSNYRPLSLLNGDVKLYGKVLAMRLDRHLS